MRLYLKQLAILTIFLVLIFSLAASAQESIQDDIKVIVSPERLAAKGGETAKVIIKVDVATDPRVDDKPISFQVSVPKDKGAITPNVFTIARTNDLSRATGDKELIYQTPSNPQPGEIIISVEGFQGIAMLGELYEGSRRYRGMGRLYLTPVSKYSGSTGPERNPPFEPTYDAVNPTREMIDRAAVIAALLALVGIANHLINRNSRRKHFNTVTITASKNSTAFTVTRSNGMDVDLTVYYTPSGTASAGSDYKSLPGEVVIPNGASSVEIPIYPIAVLEHDKTIVLTLSNKSGYIVGSPKSDTVTLKAESKPKSEWVLLATPAAINGDGNSQVELKIIGEVPDNYELHKVLYESDHQDYSISTDEDNFRKGIVRIPWEWDTLSVVFTATIKMKPTTALKSGIAATELKREASCTVRIFGANPKIVVVPDPPEVKEVNATGQDGITLKGKLWLFEGPAPKTEEILFVKASGEINGESWDKEPIPVEGDIRKERRGHEAWLTWVPPFLITEEDNETVILESQCKWVGGELWKLAALSKKGVPASIPATKCEVVVHGCMASTEAETKWFAPLPKIPLYAKARLFDHSGQGVNPFSVRSVSRDWVKVQCEVRDLSQGIPTYSNDCKLPPKSLFDSDTLVAGVSSNLLRNQLNMILQNAPIVNRPVVSVDMNGQIYTAEEENSCQVVVEEPGPPVTHSKTLRVDSPEKKFFLWNYAITPGPIQWEPIHGGAVVYKLIIADGFGGNLEVEGICQVALGSLVLETGGPDFRIYEQDPYSFEVEYQPGKNGYRHDIHDKRQVTLRWEFALVDATGKACATAGSVESSIDIVAGRFNLIVGHTRKDRDIFINRGRSAQDPESKGKVEYRPLGSASTGEFPAAMWRQVDDAARKNSLKLRHRWHALWKEQANPIVAECCKKEPGLLWLVLKGDSPWTDYTLSLAVRVEMRLEGSLVATSDRILETGIRTPPEFVWRDHRFKYVLLMLRLRLQDNRGQPYANKQYTLTIGDKTYEGKNINSQDLIELLVEDPDAETGSLQLLSADTNEAFCVYELKLGCLDPPEQESGIKARLNNLGFFASPGDKAQYERALERFQTAFNADMATRGGELKDNGVADEDTQQALDAVYMMGLPNTISNESE